MSDASLVALLLTNRLTPVSVKPFAPGEFWAFVDRGGELGPLLGATSSSIAKRRSIDHETADRVAALLGYADEFIARRGRHESEGIRLISAVDGEFPGRLRDRLARACPPFLFTTGELPRDGGIGAVGSRSVSEQALRVAADLGRWAAAEGRALVSGLARGVDREAMDAAMDAGGVAIGVPAEGISRVTRDRSVRQPAAAGHLALVSPYGLDASFSAGAAMGRNKIVYALADVTLVVACDETSGGTWEGAKESLRRSFGPVAVWAGPGAGQANPKVAALGARSITMFQQLVGPFEPPLATVQPSLF
jgi:predicted Rossmann fold nucleotide-binding protein DprA/Smf involved in DNA uptake